MRELVARVTALLRRVERAALPSATPATAVERQRSAHRRRAAAGVRRDGERGAPHADRVRPARPAWPRSPGTVLTREQLLAEVWGWADASGTRTVDSHVKALRAQARRRPGPHRARRRLRPGGRDAVTVDDLRPLDRVALDQGQARPAGRGDHAWSPSVLAVVRHAARHARRGPPCRSPSLLALAVTQLLARGMTSPLREMTAAARRMARGDYARRVSATRATRSASWPGRSTDGRRPGRRSTGSGASWWPTSSHELRTPDLRAAGRAGEPRRRRRPRRTRRRCGRRWRRPSGSAGWSSDLLDLSRVDAGDGAAAAASRVRLHGLPRRRGRRGRGCAGRAGALRRRVDPPDLTRARRPGPAAPAGREPAGQRRPAQPRRRHGHGRRRDRRRDRRQLEVADEGPGIAAGRPRARVFERFTTAAPAAAAAAPASAWPSPAGSPSCTGAPSPSPRPPTGGCRILVVLPADADRPTSRQGARHEHPDPARARTPHAGVSGPDGLATYWPDAPRRRPGIVAAAAAAGALAATVLPERALGVGTFLVLAAVVGTVFAARTTRIVPPSLDLPRRPGAALVLLLLSMLFVRDAEWITLLCLVAALALTAVNSTRAASVLGLLGTAAAVPLAAVRGLPWVGRTLKPRGSVQAWLPAARTAVLSAVLLAVFVGLFASADALFASWWRLCPQSHMERPAGACLPRHVRRRGHAGRGVRGPGPTVLDRLRQPHTSRPMVRVARPVLVVDPVFPALLVAQATAMFGGHDYLQRTTGLTYAEYVHEGFGQLTVATVLTFTVMRGLRARRPRAPTGPRARSPERDDPRRGRLGALPDAPLRGGVRVHPAPCAGLCLRGLARGGGPAGRRRRRGWRGPWLSPSRSVGGGHLLGLALVNPDLYIAQHNIARAPGTVGVDWEYLGKLSTDAYPALVRLPDEQFRCAAQRWPTAMTTGSRGTCPASVPETFPRTGCPMASSTPTSPARSAAEGSVGSSAYRASPRSPGSPVSVSLSDRGTWTASPPPRQYRPRPPPRPAPESARDAR